MINVTLAKIRKKGINTVSVRAKNIYTDGHSSSDALLLEHRAQRIQPRTPIVPGAVCVGGIMLCY